MYNILHGIIAEYWICTCVQKSLSHRYHGGSPTHAYMQSRHVKYIACQLSMHSLRLHADDTW